jgi:hypothetical protein
MKYCAVDKDGNLSLQGDPRLLYATMLAMRMWIIGAGWKCGAFSTIIAARYSCVRRQFLTIEDNPTLERKLIDYQAQ